ncbi:GNAT family N-acetyltransferase [Dactylosporangium darangshiense]|uniref:GNAT family N-acetyltransferase n=1 Tax=Dactylosporangium darangshiense TaxID=579108 RepID=UPI00362D5003
MESSWFRPGFAGSSKSTTATVVDVPGLVNPALPAGALRALTQPRLVVDDDLTLRPWRADDADAIRTAFATPDIQRWHMRSIDGDDEVHQWIEDWTTSWHAETDAGWAIARTSDDQAIGQASLRSLALFAAQAQVSYWVVPAARGARVAARATRALTHWAFEVLRLHRVFLLHSTANPASCRVALNCGFPAEGTLRGYMLHTDGWHDMHIHARLHTDL